MIKTVSSFFDSYTAIVRDCLSKHVNPYYPSNQKNRGSECAMAIIDVFAVFDALLFLNRDYRDLKRRTRQKLHYFHKKNPGNPF